MEFRFVKLGAGTTRTEFAHRPSPYLQTLQMRVAIPARSSEGFDTVCTIVELLPRSITVPLEGCQSLSWQLAVHETA